VSLQHPTPWTWEEHELSEGYSCIIYDARGYQVGGFGHLDRETANDIVECVNARLERRIVQRDAG
jgi:hypothetical protein